LEQAAKGSYAVFFISTCEEYVDFHKTLLADIKRNKNMTKNASSKIALITGGSSGIGYAIAKKLSSEGIIVIVADLMTREDEENIIFKECDVSRGKDVDALYTWINDHYKNPDYLILNAGRGIQEKLTEGDPEKWQQVIHTNLMGPLRFIRAFTPGMLERKKGSVIFISSVSANQPHPYGGIYSASKSALEVVAETLRLETIPNINVTVVSPGIVDTEFFSNQISGNSTVKDLDMGAIAAEEIADDVWYALNKKPGTSINKIVTRPTLQNF
jgi:NADP-dependent 3-hydroxy acid dehydrogenase YdfG